MKDLWDLAFQDAKLDISSLPRDLQECVMKGDGVADHYGGRTEFTFIEQKEDEVLVLEKIDDLSVVVKSVVNMTGGYGTGILGSGVNRLASDLSSMLTSSVTTNDEFHSPERRRLVNKITSLIADHTCSSPTEWTVTFTSSGSEAVDLALQLVYLEGLNLSTGVSSRKNKDIVLSCHGAWHGWSQGPNQLLDRKQFTEGIPRCSGLAVDFLRYGDIEDLKAKFTQYAGRIRAVAVEGILGDGGVITATQDWWEELFNLAANEDARILDDEILTGFRTGGLLAIPRGLAPDCITLGKALGFGLFPISAVVWRNSKLTLRPGIGVRTFNARPFQAAVVCAGIEIIEQQSLFERSTVLGRRLHTALASVVNDHPSVFKQVRGQGLFLGIELSDAYARRGRLVRDTMIRHGVLTEIESGIFSRKVPKNKRINETIRLTPPLTISDATISTALASFTSAAQELDSGLVKEAV